jgi:quinolinate synthase
MPKKDLISKIERIKKDRDAIILAHNYQIPEVQDIADLVGDSLDLSRRASLTQAEVIVFCGVSFMAETAHILNPQKKVLLPDLEAGCPLADMITKEQLLEKKNEYPEAVVVCYVNTSAEIKAYSDICCTSANAIKVVNSIPLEKEIIFIPDRCLGNYTQINTKRKLILWNGICPTHLRFLKEDIQKLKEEHPEAEVLVHPECEREVIQIADHAFSTNGMINYVKKSPKKKFIIGTEVGIIYRLKKENPDKIFIPANPEAICPNMKLTNLEKILFSLENMENIIEVPEEIRIRAKRAVDKMLKMV